MELRTRRWIWASALAVCVWGCGGPEENPDDGPKPTVSAGDKAKVQEALDHLNNESSTERWREQLVEVGAAKPVNHTYVIEQCAEAYSRSRSRRGRGPGVLRPEGRRRAIEAVGKLSDVPAGRELLQQALDDDQVDVRTSAAAGLARWGDERAVPILIECVLQLDAGEPVYREGVQALRGLATPERRGVFLDTLSGRTEGTIRDVVLRTFPEGGARSGALREVVRDHDNPYARAFALEILAESGDAQLLELARLALNSGDEVLRPVALAALGSAGGDAAASEIEQVLRQDPADAEDVARGLFEVGTEGAVDRAASVITDRTLEDATRAAVGRAFFVAMGDDGASAVYRAPEVRRRALRALNEVLEERNGPPVLAAIAAVGAIGDGNTDARSLQFLTSTPDPEVTSAVAQAWGRLGGPFAAQQLVNLVRVDPGAREAASQALAGFERPRDVPMNPLIELLAHGEREVRLAAWEALQGLTSQQGPQGYNPDGTSGELEAAVERWQQWWTERRG